MLTAKGIKAESSVSGNFDANIDAQMYGSLKLIWIYFPLFLLGCFFYPRARATGKMEFNVKLFSKNPILFEQNGKLFLKFNSGLKLYGRLHDWNILTGDADGCTVKLFGRNPSIGY